MGGVRGVWGQTEKYFPPFSDVDPVQNWSRGGSGNQPLRASAEVWVTKSQGCTLPPPIPTPLKPLELIKVQHEPDRGGAMGFQKPDRPHQSWVEHFGSGGVRVMRPAKCFSQHA